MSEILKRNKDTRIKWKTFIFPLSIKDFSLKELAKVATYEYAWRNWAEHERVLSHRVFSVSWEFIPWVDKNKTPAQLIYDLRLTNNNKPWIFSHPDIGSFNCIISNLTIWQTWDWYSTISEEYKNKYNDSRVVTWFEPIATETLYTSYTFSIEFLEHTPPNAKTLKEKSDELFPKSVVKPVNDLYNTQLIYKNSDELFNAIMAWKIAPWVNPVINAEWLKYDYDMRKIAYDKWKDTWFAVWVVTIDVATTNTNQRNYTVLAWDTWFKISKKFKVTFTDLFEKNRWVKVRKNSNGNEWLYWKTARLLYAWDKIIIPN